MRKIFLLCLILNSCSDLKQSIGFRFEQQKLYDKCVEQYQREQYCFEQSNRKISDFKNTIMKKND